MLVRILSCVQKMGWQTTLNTWVRVLLVHLFTPRRVVPQVFLKEFGAFVDAVHGWSTVLRVGGTPIAIARSHVAWPGSQQFCDLTQVSCKRIEMKGWLQLRRSSLPRYFSSCLTGKPQGKGRYAAARSESRVVCEQCSQGKGVSGQMTWSDGVMTMSPRQIGGYESLRFNRALCKTTKGVREVGRRKVPGCVQTEVMEGGCCCEGNKTRLERTRHVLEGKDWKEEANLKVRRRREDSWTPRRLREDSQEGEGEGEGRVRVVGRWGGRSVLVGSSFPQVGGWLTDRCESSPGGGKVQLQ